MTKIEYLLLLISLGACGVGGDRLGQLLDN